MPLFIDVHNHVEGLTADAVAHAHEADLSAIAVHREAHGLIADELTEVKEGV